jgi:aminoglycoside phosphotransferase (APT) family kinase protein
VTSSRKEQSTGADPAVVGPYLAKVLDEPAWAACSVDLITGGKSNLTYRVTSPAGAVVLRRPPLGNVLPTAHDMVREHTVIAGLAGTPVPVPPALHLCTDTDVLGAPFYVMGFVDGPIARDGFPPGYADRPQDRKAVADGLIDTLVALHAVDPNEIGLADFGRPEGYLTRQVSRWMRQWAATRDAVESTAAAGQLDQLAQTLADSAPTAPTGPIVHGDYRLDNTVLDPAGPGRIAAVLDWEMSTRGDPLADVGLLLVYWVQATDDSNRTGVLPIAAVSSLPGFPTRREVAEQYAAKSGRDLSRLPWYVSFGAFKLAVVVAGIVARHRAGAMLGEGFDNMESRLGPLVELAYRAHSGDVD